MRSHYWRSCGRDMAGKSSTWVLRSHIRAQERAPATSRACLMWRYTMLMYPACRYILFGLHTLCGFVTQFTVHACTCTYINFRQQFCHSLAAKFCISTNKKTKRSNLTTRQCVRDVAILHVYETVFSHCRDNHSFYCRHLSAISWWL